VSVNRVVGVFWIAEQLYPDIYDYDLPARVKAFYSLFYGADLTDGQISALIDP